MSCRTSIGRVELRAVQRAPICVRALAAPRQREPTEHLTFDLSVAGVRLCGHPRAEIGDEAQVWLYFSQNLIPRATGHVLRVCETDARPECVIRFDSVPDDSRQLIQKRADAALSGNASRSVLLFEAAHDAGEGRRWLNSLRSRCHVVQQIGKLAESLVTYRIETAVVGSDYHEMLAEWAAAYPHVSWRSIDAQGQLHG